MRKAFLCFLLVALLCFLLVGCGRVRLVSAATRDGDGAKSHDSSIADEAPPIGGEGTEEGTAGGDNTVAEPTPSDGEEGRSDEIGDVAAVIRQYSNYLNVGRGRLYACQQARVYLEGNDYVTYNQGTTQHKILFYACAVNALASPGRGDTFTVTDGEISAAVPDAIIKLVPSSVLGKNVTDSRSADLMLTALSARGSIPLTLAAADGKLMLVSEELLSSETGRLATEFLVARLCYPDYFDYVDMEKTLGDLLGEGGLYYTVMK